MTAAAALLRRLDRRAATRVHTPTILQMEAVECGAAALAMVMAYHGRWAPLEEVRQLCGVSRDGTKASNILKAARHYGLAAKGFRKEPEQLTALPLPSIIHWNFNHFVVFEGVDKRWAYLNDPALGRTKVPLQELSECFTGVVLALEPTADFAVSRRPSGLSFGRELGSAGPSLSIVLLASLLLVVPGVAAPVFAKVFVDQVLVGHLQGWLQPLLLGMAATALLLSLLLWLQRHYLLRLETALAIAMGGRFVWHVLRLPAAFFNQRHAGDVARRIATNDDVSNLLSGGLASAALSLATALLFLAVMALLSLPLTGIALATALLNWLALRLTARRREDAARRVQREQGQLAGASLGVLRTIETLKAGGLEQDAFGRWAGYQAKALAASREFERASLPLRALPPLLTALGNAALLAAGALAVLHGRMSVGDLVAFLALAASFAAPIGQMVGLGASLQEIRAALARLGDVLAYPPDPRAAAQATAPVNAAAGAARLQGAVELQGVSFGYNPNEPPLIRDFDLAVRPGMRVALVGASGSGKSTLGRLICGLYRPDAGEIRFDGIPAAEVPAPVLANSLSYVDQEIFLFAGSVRDNLSLWDSTVDEATLTQALKDAAIFEEIAVRPGRHDHRVEEGGVNFSGGQRQRLEIARALVTDPAVIVLDEAMAALDPVVEQQIDDNLRRRGCTCIIIAHRLSTIRDCDEIVMLARGEVAGRGTHEQLLRDCPAYAEMVQAQ